MGSARPAPERPPYRHTHHRDRTRDAAAAADRVRPGAVWIKLQRFLRSTALELVAALSSGATSPQSRRCSRAVSRHRDQQKTARRGHRLRRRRHQARSARLPGGAQRDATWRNARRLELGAHVAPPRAVEVGVSVRTGWRAWDCGQAHVGQPVVGATRCRLPRRRDPTSFRAASR